MHTHAYIQTYACTCRFCTRSCTCGPKQDNEEAPPQPKLCAWRVTFLGTGASAPFKYRTVSSILVGLNTSGGDAGVDGYVMLDAGDGSYGTMVRKYGVKGADDVLCSMKMLFVSHKHADHISGAAKLLLKRREAFAKRGIGAQRAASAPSEWSCAVCAARFSYKSSLDMHARACHPRVQPQAYIVAPENGGMRDGPSTADAAEGGPLCECVVVHCVSVWWFIV
jgi:hypothetical protein